MTNPDALLAAYDSQLRQWMPANPPAGIRYDRDGPVLRVVGQHRGFVDTARNVGVTGAALDEVIRAQRDFFARRGEAVEWKTRAHDEPADLTVRLRKAGFVPEDRETVLVAATSRMAAPPRLPPGVVLRQVSQRTDFERIAALQSEVWAEDLGWMADDLEESVRAAPDEISVFVAEADGRVVSAARLELKPGTDFAGLWSGATLADWRGRGIYRALVARRAQLAQERGVRYLQVDASDASRPILLRLGFQTITTTTPYVWTPPVQTPPVQSPPV